MLLKDKSTDEEREDSTGHDESTVVYNYIHGEGLSLRSICQNKILVEIIYSFTFNYRERFGFILLILN